jgi:hypothetical protein
MVKKSPAKSQQRAKKKNSTSVSRARRVVAKANLIKGAGKPKRKAPKKAKQARRAETETAIIDAFERVLLRDGASKIAINEIAREAGVSKPMIYDYFGGLGGVLIAWNKKHTFGGQPAGDFNLGKDPKTDADTLANILVQLADNLKSNPARLEIHADEISPHSVFTPYKADIFTNLACATDKFFDQFPTKPNVQQQQVFSVILAAVMYLALRKRSSPQFLNLDFATEAGWEKTMQILAQVARSAFLAA